MWVDYTRLIISVGCRKNNWSGRDGIHCSTTAMRSKQSTPACVCCLARTQACKPQQASEWLFCSASKRTAAAAQAQAQAPVAEAAQAEAAARHCCACSARGKSILRAAVCSSQHNARNLNAQVSGAFAAEDSPSEKFDNRAIVSNSRVWLMIFDSRSNWWPECGVHAWPIEAFSDKPIPLYIKQADTNRVSPDTWEGGPLNYTTTISQLSCYAAQNIGHLTPCGRQARSRESLFKCALIVQQDTINDTHEQQRANRHANLARELSSLLLVKIN